MEEIPTLVFTQHSFGVWDDHRCDDGDKGNRHGIFRLLMEHGRFLKDFSRFIHAPAGLSMSVEPTYSASGEKDLIEHGYHEEAASGCLISTVTI